VPFCTDNSARQSFSSPHFSTCIYFDRPAGCRAFRFLGKWKEAASVGGLFRFEHVVLKGHAFGIVFRKLGFRGVSICEDLEMIAVSDLFARIHVD
jgi:hypothetical protein